MAITNMKVVSIDTFIILLAMAAGKFFRVVSYAYVLFCRVGSQLALGQKIAVV